MEESNRKILEEILEYKRKSDELKKMVLAREDCIKSLKKDASDLE